MPKIHICVGFYNDGSFKINYVADEDLADNIQYNKDWRPGRFYFVDGKYACGGILRQPYQDERIKEYEARIAAMNLTAPNVPSRPYE